MNYIRAIRCVMYGKVRAPRGLVQEVTVRTGKEIAPMPCSSCRYRIL